MIEKKLYGYDYIKSFMILRDKAIFEAFTAPKPFKKRQKQLAVEYQLSVSHIRMIVSQQKKLLGWKK